MKMLGYTQRERFSGWQKSTDREGESSCTWQNITSMQMLHLVLHPNDLKEFAQLKRIGMICQILLSTFQS